MTRHPGRSPWSALLLSAALLLAAPLRLHAQLPPDARWHTLDTPHFRVHFTEGLEPLARRAADRAERAHAQISRALVRPPRGKVELVVTDNVDYANGYATPLPTNRVVIYAHPPTDEPALSFNEDWLQLVITHELTHIFHLDYAGGIWDDLRRVLGRSPVTFPETLSPPWVTEGLATYMESRLTRAGRVRGTIHEMELRTAVLEDAFFPIDRASGDPATWPAGSARYVYGSLFIEHLAERYGPEKVSDFVRIVGGSLVPYLFDRAARRAFGVSFTTAWGEWEDSLRARYRPLADSLRAAGFPEPEDLTREGRYTQFPRYAPDGSLAFYSSTGREEAATRLLAPGGGERVLAPRTSLGPTTWLPDGRALLYTQLDYRDPYRIRSDLYRADLAGRRTRLTRGARISEPDVARDGRSVVAVQDAGGTSVLVRVDLATGAVRRLTAPSYDEQWSLPRWSPTGDRIAAARWRAGGYFDIVVLDPEGRVLRELTHDRAVDNEPAWSPDGRYVVFSSDRTGIDDLYAYDLRDDRLYRVTGVTTGAFQPDVSPDGRWIAFAHYHADGYHLARVPFDPARWRPAPPVRAAVDLPPLDPSVYTAAAGGPVRRYSPWRSLAPATWSPVLDVGGTLGLGIGAAVGGEDVVGRHTYAAYGVVYPDGGRVEGSAAYRYTGLGVPVLDLSASQDWAGVGVRDSTGTVVPDRLLERERLAGMALTFPRPRYRSYTWLSLGASARDYDYAWKDPGREGNRAVPDLPPELGGSLTAGLSTVRGYAFSISPEDGFLMSGTAEGRRYTRAVGRDDGPTGYVRLTGRARAYRGIDWGGWARHALAARLTTGAEWGPRAPVFRVGGTGGGPSPFPLAIDLGSGSLTYPLRGYPGGIQAGDRAVSASTEYRFPLRLVERGYRLAPLWLDRLWGDAFADAGAAWCGTAECRARFRAPLTSPRPLYSVGAELGVDFSAGYYLGSTLRAGVAVPLRELPGSGRPNPVAYLRFGRSF